MKLSFGKQKVEKSDWIVFGVPDESGSHSQRKGTRFGPDRIRKISHSRGVFVRYGQESVVQPENGVLKDNISDLGDVEKKNARAFAREAVYHGKKIAVLGGDHSITFEILKGINDIKKDVSVIYLDAHPDFVCSSHRYYGSVLCDVIGLNNINLKKSVEVGIRASEKEELVNVKKHHVLTITPVDIVERGIVEIVKEIKKRVGGNIYLSIDMDVIDPAFAPGVSTPVPGGLTSNEFMYLIKKISELGLIGFDIMETTPRYDIQEMTSHLAVSAIEEIVSK